MAQSSQPTSRSSNFGLWLFCLWAFLCVALYIYKIPLHFISDIQNLLLSFQNSNWDWSQVFQIEISHVLVLLIGFAYLMLFLGTGKRLLKLFIRSELSSIECWVWSFALGLMFWGLLAESLALTHLFYIRLLQVVAILALVLLLVWDRLVLLTRCWPIEKGRSISWPWKVVLATVLALTLSNLLAPEMSWDAITYQLVLPRYYLIQHGFYSVLGVVPAQYPSLGEMFFSWGLIWGDDSIARFMCFLAHIATALTLVVFGERLKFEKAGWYAAAFYFFFPYLNIYSTRGYVDLFVGFYATLGLGLLVCSAVDEKKEAQKNILFLASVTLGVIWAIKYNAIFYSATALVLLLWKFSKRKDCTFLAVSLLLLPLFFWAPWALKSWEYVHDPTFPYLSNWFHSFNWTELDERASSIKFPIAGWKGLVRLPLILFGIFFNNYSGAPNEEVGLAILVFAPLLFVKKIQHKGIGLLGLSVLMPFLFWLVSSHQLRLIVPVIALTSLIVGLGFELVIETWESRSKVFVLIPLFLASLSSLYLFQGLLEQPNPFAHLLGIQSREKFLSEVMQPQGYVTLNEYLNHALPTNAKVLILGQQNGYYLYRTNIYDFDYNHSVLKQWADAASTPEELYGQFRKNDVGYILYNSTGMMGSIVRTEELGIDKYVWDPAKLHNYEQFLLKYTRKLPLPVAGGYALYQVASRDGFSTMPEFLPGTERYYLDDMVRLMGLKKVSDIVGRSLSSDVYAKAYDSVAKQHAEIGYPSFQSAVAELAGGNGSIKEVLEKGRTGLARNGDQASWAALQAYVLLQRNQSKAAVPFLERSQLLSPERDDVARNLSVAYYNEHHLDKAIGEAQIAVNLAPYLDDNRKLLSQLQSLQSGR